MPDELTPSPPPDADRESLRAAALEAGPCGRTGADARIAALLAHPGTWAAPPDLPEGGIAALIARAEAAPDDPFLDDFVPPSFAPPSPPSPNGPTTYASSAAAAGDAASADVVLPGGPRPSTSPDPDAVPASSGPDRARPADGRPPRGPGADRARPGGARRRRRQWVTAAALALVLVAGGIAGVLITRDRPSATIQLAGAAAAPQARGSIQIIERDAGWRLVLDAQGLAPAPAGSYYQGWAVRGDEYVPLGTFHMHQEGRVELWSGVPLRVFRRIEITSQRVGAGQTPGPPVLAGAL